MPRVVHVATSHYVDDVRIFERECRSLAASGRFQVAIAGPGVLPSESGVGLVQFGRIPQGTTRRLTVGLWRAWSIARRIKAEIWHFHDPEALPVVALLSRFGRTVVWDAHEDYQARFSENRRGGFRLHLHPLQKLTSLILDSLLRQVDTHAAGIVAATPAIAARYTNPKTVVVGNEARLETFAECKPKFSSMQILFTGSPNEAHLFTEVVEAVAQIPSVHLAIAGRQPDPAIWERAKLQLNDRLIHLGWLDRRSLASAINSSTLGMLTYQNRPTKDTAAATKGFEFAAAGLPVVATSNKVNLNNINHHNTGFLAKDFTSNAIKDAILLALSDPQEWQRASECARA